MADPNNTFTDSSEPNDLIIAKVTAILVLGIVSFLLGVLPALLSRWFTLEKGGRGVSLLLCFGGGVLMYTTFLHLQPEVRESFDELVDRGLLPELTRDVNLPELIFCIGFFFVYLIEEVVHGVLDRKHDHSDEEAVLHRTLSLRVCKEDPPALIPRASLSPDMTKSVSKQILIDSASSEGTPDLDYIPKLDHILTFAKPTPNFIHEHVPYDDDSFAKSLRAFCTILALSFHAVFEGLAVGLEDSVTTVWYMAGAVAAHKFVISFCVGIELLTSKTRMLLVVLYIGTFAVVTPIGIGIGIGLSHGESADGGVANAVLQAMAAGTLLYVVFFEVLQRERSNGQSGILQLIAIVAGFGVMLGLGILTSEGHKHSHNHGEDQNPLDHHHS